MARHNYTGKLGEDIACKFLLNNDMRIIERNYWRKWGEIDIVACEKSGLVHFVEVKSTERTYTCNQDDWDPVEMIHSNKIKRLRRIIETYIIENDVNNWVFDVIVVYINKKNKEAQCKWIKDIVI